MSDAMSYPIKPPPRGEDLPYSDGEPMESERHVLQMTLLVHSLKDFWRERDDVYVAGNMFVYFSETQAKKNDFRGPDVFVVMDTHAHERKSWVVWEENGRTPDVVVELLSASTERVDRGDKMRIYARMLHVGEYYLFDPFTGVLEGYALDRGTRTYHRRDPDLAGGDFASATTGLALGVRHGKHGGVEAPWLRWITPQGFVVPTADERSTARATLQHARADAEKARADEEKARADEEKARADEEKARANEEKARANEEKARANEEKARADAAEQRIAELEAQLKRS